MKKIKYVLLIICLLLTGCTCEYNLKIDDKFRESITINFANNDDNEYFLNNKKIPVDAETYKLFSSIPIDEETGQIPEIEYDSEDYEAIVRQKYAKYSYDFSKIEISKSTAISLCYDSYTITNREGSIIISTNNIVKCFENNPELTELKVNITTAKEVESNNADKINNNTYTWNINKNNYKNKPINMVIKNPNTNIPNEEELNKKEVYFSNPSFYITLLVILLVAIIGYCLIKKIKNNNENNSIDE